MSKKSKYKMKDSLFWLIVFVLSLAIYTAVGLVISEISQGDVCPKLLGIPACYLVLLGFLLAMISHILDIDNNHRLYYTSIGLLGLLAITGTLGEIFGFTKCPRSSFGVPMCYISLGICLFLIIAKFFYSKM